MKKYKEVEYGRYNFCTFEIIIDLIEKKTNEELWNCLYQYDAQRAKTIHVQDRYRIIRALEIAASGIQPSLLIPEYVPFPADVLLLFLSRPRQQLYERINDRTEVMMKQGWIDEVKTLLGTEWEQFLLRKKIIGYNQFDQE